MTLVGGNGSGGVTASAVTQYFPLGGGIKYAATGSGGQPLAQAAAHTVARFTGTTGFVRAHITANTYNGASEIALQSNGSDVISVSIPASTSGFFLGTIAPATHSIASSDVIGCRLTTGGSGSMMVAFVATEVTQ